MGTLTERPNLRGWNRYGVALTAHPGGTVKIVWLLLAIPLTCLAIGGLVAASKGADAQSVTGDLVISAILGIGALACWQRTRA